MNQLQAMRDTIDLMSEGLRRISEDGDTSGDEQIYLTKLWQVAPSTSPGHLKDMLRALEIGDNPQHPGEKFGEAKIGRWLGWAQASVVAMGLASLDDMKAINMRNSDG